MHWKTFHQNNILFQSVQKTFAYQMNFLKQLLMEYTLNSAAKKSFQKYNLGTSANIVRLCITTKGAHRDKWKKNGFLQIQYLEVWFKKKCLPNAHIQ